MAARKRILKRLVMIVVALAALFFLVRGAVSFTYSCKLKTQVKRFEALGGSYSVSVLFPRTCSFEENAANLVTAAGLLYDEPGTVLVRLNTSAFNSRIDRKEGATLAPISPAFGQSIRDAERIVNVFDRFATWRGFDRHFALRAGQGGEVPWNDAWMPCLEKWIADNRIPLDLAKRAAEIGAASFDCDWDMGYYARLPHLSMLAELSRLLSIDAVVKAKNGDVAGAMDSVRLSFRLRRLIDNQPFLITRFVSWDLDDVAFGTLQGVLDTVSPDAKDVEALLEELNDRESRNVLTTVLLSEAIAGRQAFRESQTDSTFPGPTPQSVWANFEFAGVAPHRVCFALVWIPSADEYNYLKDMCAFVEQSMLPFPEALDAAWYAPPFGARVSLPFTTRFVGYFLEPPLMRLIAAQAQRDADIRMARTVLALTLYKSENGAYPDTLDPLVPEYLPALQIDPFDGKPLRFAKRGEGFVVYSVYKDKTDDGGVYKGPNTDTGDLTWERSE